MDTLTLDRQLNDMIIAGKSVEALRRYYAADVIAQENDEPERLGLEPWILARREVAKLTRKFSARILSHAANGDVTFSEWEYKMDLEGMGAMVIAQVAVRRWKDGKVVRERFYHK